MAAFGSPVHRPVTLAPNGFADGVVFHGRFRILIRFSAHPFPVSAAFAARANIVHFRASHRSDFRATRDRRTVHLVWPAETHDSQRSSPGTNATDNTVRTSDT